MRILAIADLHIGAIKDGNYIYNVTTDIFEKELVVKHCDMVVFLGDYFDKLFRANDENVALAINIMTNLVNICKQRKIKIRMITGTESHDMHQYTLFNYHLSSKDIDMRVINTVTEETIAGCKILYVPEEYMNDKHEFYKDTIYSGKKYDYIFGHGVIAEGMPMVNRSSSEKASSEKKVPIFRSGALSSISKVTLFGHYHCYTDMGDNCYYVGSLFRWCFGEDITKGYMIIDNDKVEFIENEAAYEYKTYSYDADDKIFEGIENIDAELKRIHSENGDIISGKRFGKIRMVLNAPSGLEDSFKENIKTILFNEKAVSSLFKEKIITQSTDADEEDAIEQEFQYLFDKSMPIENKIHTYINKKSPDINLDIKELFELINSELKI